MPCKQQAFAQNNGARPCHLNRMDAHEMLSLAALVACRPGALSARDVCTESVTAARLRAGSSLTQPQMVVMSDIDEPFVPLPDDLLVNLAESRAIVEALLDSLPTTFSGNAQVLPAHAARAPCVNECAKPFTSYQEFNAWRLCVGVWTAHILGEQALTLNCSSGKMLAMLLKVSFQAGLTLPSCCTQTHSATGPALQAAFMVMSSVGGKMLLFQAASPSVGVGRIKNRDMPALYGTERHAA